MNKTQTEAGQGLKACPKCGLARYERSVLYCDVDLAAAYKAAWNDLRRYIYDKDADRREEIIKRHQAKIDALLSGLRHTSTATDWHPLETTPAAMCVLAARFDHDCGDWAYSVVLSPPSHPFTHWRLLPEPPQLREGKGHD